MKLKQNFLKLLNLRASRHEPDKILVFTVGAIILFGLIMLTSASGGYSFLRYGDGYYFLKHQLLALAIGSGLYWFCSKMDYHQWRKISFVMLVLSVVLLALVFVPGLSSAANFKARSWINVFGFSLQPSELVKLSFLIYLAAWLETRKKHEIEDIAGGLAPFLTSLAIIAGLMLAQPDFGTLVIIGMSALAAFFVGGGKIQHMLGLGLIGLVVLSTGMMFKGYQTDRFRCYMDPSYSSGDACYQVNQALIAIGSGGVWGRGFGASRQKMMYLPEVSGDSIFPIISEELGFIFSAALVLGYMFFFYRVYLVSRDAPDSFGKVLSIGIATWIVIQAVINIGGQANLIPMTGVPLPFVSYGGSAIMSAMAAVGIIVNISKQTRVS